MNTVGSTVTGSKSSDRRWLIAHVASLVFVIGTLVIAGRDQWFYFDEWDFVATRAEWNLLTPHVGHLSFFPQLLTTLVKGVVGIHSYWPFLALTFAAHLLVVHLLWRIMLRVGVAQLISLLVPVAFGVLSAGAENTLWAFQVGFITPIATGMAALLVAMRSSLRTRDIIAIAALLLVGIGFSGTALPMTAAVLLFLLVRHGWRTALMPAVPFAVVYGTWYLAFNTGPRPEDSFKASGLGQLLVSVPEYVTRGLVDSVGKMGPTDAFAAAMLLALGIWVILDLRRSTLRTVGPVHYLLFAALFFAFLTAYSRLNLGVASASSGRYVYMYAALLAPAFALALTALVGHGRVALGVVAAVLAVLVIYNAGALQVVANEQAAVEQSVNRAISAAISIDDGSPALADLHPAPAIAPTLTMSDIRSFENRDEYSTVPFTPQDLLDVSINLRLTANSVAGTRPAVCAPAASDGWVNVDPGTQDVYATQSGAVAVFASDGSVTTQYAQLRLQAGMNHLTGLDPSVVDLKISTANDIGVCVSPVG